MKIIFIVTFLTFTVYAQDIKSDFMKMCMNPTVSQKVTFEALSKARRLSYGKESCENIAEYYIKTKMIKRGLPV